MILKECRHYLSVSGKSGLKSLLIVGQEYYLEGFVSEDDFGNACHHQGFFKFS